MNKIIRNNFLLLLILVSLTNHAFTQNLPTLSLAQLTQELEKQDDTLRIVNLWATWCKPCVEELPDFIELASAYKTAGKAVKFMLIAVEDKFEKVQAFIENKKPFFYVLTEKDANIWIPQIDAKWEGEIPATLLVNIKQNIRVFKAKQLTRNELENLINLHLKKK